ncbi:hypothetical protein GTU73_04120 [Rathayibacter sp. VKM Ac-2804]|jgi:hypothetical protein|uniref:hypothetical protein n=1 Tax=unclassified Rathayibacter TaxID=2609250 RepID=UPI00132F457B|nr:MULTISPECIES: hypothetical protein [unclassified Rathayibacter]NRG40560.1 hypothetical protein [Rathayibacter sp. VKM Ac-2835]QHF23277.1 hypothetical protein GTU73_04120 [Rathayibacter sp. VKM Ac-2804]
MPDGSRSQHDGVRRIEHEPEAGVEPTGLEAALAAPVDAMTDPGPGERSGLSSRIAEELLDGTSEMIGGDAAPALTRSVEIDDPARAVGDDPAHPIHGTLRQEFETR